MVGIIVANPGNMVPGMPGKPEDPGPNPQSCDIGYLQSREWGHQEWLGHFQEGQKGLNQVQRAQEGHPEGFPQLQCYGPFFGKSTDCLSVVGL